MDSARKCRAAHALGPSRARGRFIDRSRSVLYWQAPAGFAQFVQLNGRASQRAVERSA